MFNSSKAFGMAFLVLTMSAFIAILAACGSSSTSGGGEPSEPSSTSTQPSSAGETISGELADIRITATLMSGEKILDISANVAAVDQRMEFDKIDILLDNSKKINENNAGKGDWVYEYSDRYTFGDGGREFCVDRDVQVVLNVYKDGKILDTKIDTFRRSVNLCNPSSSSVASSSSAAVLRFERLNIGGSETLTLNSHNGARGIMFGSNTRSTDNVNEADIYYDAPSAGQHGVIKTKSSGTVKLIQTFNGSEKLVRNLSNPQSTSDFPLKDFDERESQIDYPRDMYFMVRTNSTASVWTTDDYLLAVPDESPAQGSGNNKSIKIMVWKVVQ